MKTKIIAVILCIATLLSAFSFYAFAEDSLADGFYYTEADGGVTITGTTLTGNITVPVSLGGKTVKAIGEKAFANTGSITSVTFAEGNSVSTIGKNAFHNCYGLTKINLEKCTKLTEISDYAFSSCRQLKSVTVSGLTTLGIYAFYSCSELESAAITGSLTEIKDYAFYLCPALKTADLTNCKQLTAIKAYAFDECTSLETLCIPASLTTLEDHAFGGDTAIKNVNYCGTPSTKNKIAFGSDYGSLLTAAWSYHYMTAHSYTSEITKEPTCVDFGEKTFTCVCGSEYTEKIDPTGKHSYNYAVTKKPSCEEKGTGTYTCCVCHDSYNVEIAATGHTASDWIVTVEPTVNSKGEKVKKCKTCGKTLDTQEMPELVPEIKIRNNKTGSISIDYKQGIKLTAQANYIPEGGKIMWYADNGTTQQGNEFSLTKIKDSFKVTVKVIDAQGNVLDVDGKEISDSEQINVNASFFKKLAAFFKGLFGGLKTVVQEVNV